MEVYWTKSADIVKWCTGTVDPGSAAKCPCEQGDVLIIRILDLQGNQNTALDLLWSRYLSPPSLPLLKSCAADEIQVSVISTHSWWLLCERCFYAMLIPHCPARHNIDFLPICKKIVRAITQFFFIITQSLSFCKFWDQTFLDLFVVR